jgi:uncharacterized ferritin-like protein (DUF455 family)
MLELRETSLAILANTDVQAKVSQLYHLFDEYQHQRIDLNLSASLDSQELMLPGRPLKPELVPPLQAPKRRMTTVEGRIILLHSLAHIEFNAMNLALDAVIARMALVPRTMEARGLDAVPGIRDRFKQIKDDRAVEILGIILNDEIGHVLIGNRWFNFLCARDNVSPIMAYRELAKKYRAPTLRGPFNIEARKQAGFTSEELSLMESA